MLAAADLGKIRLVNRVADSKKWNNLILSTVRDPSLAGNTCHVILVGQ
jgi:catabolite regulation protein CreA